MVTSWLLDLTASALAKDEQLEGFSGNVEDSGEGRWTIEAAIEEAVPADVLAASLFVRFRSRQQHTFAEKVLSAMRLGFGGHVEATQEITKEDTRCALAPSISRRITASTSPSWRGRWRTAASIRCSCPSTPTSRPAASRPSPAAASCPSATPTPTIRSSALAFAAAATKKLKLGTGILLVPQHEPIVTAKAIA